MPVSEITCPECKGSALKSGDDVEYTCSCGWHQLKSSVQEECKVLLSCPFCDDEEIKSFHPPQTNWYYRVQCKCTACGPVKDNKEEAINAWNKRSK